MAIIGLKDRKTLLKSLRFGNDVKGGGDSGQPFIKSELANEGGAGSDFINGLVQNSYGDYPIRGNTMAIVKTAEDAIRIGKFTTSFPQGLLFIAKQTGLNASNPLIQTGQQGSLRNTQQYNVGNTLRQVAVQGSGVHLPQAGIGVNELQNPKNKYSYIVSHEEKDENRLLNLKYITDTTGLNKEDQNKFSTSPTAQNSRQNLGFAEGAIKRSGLMLNYFGGPGSLYGLGNTLISYSTDNQGSPINTFKAPKFIGPYKTEGNKQDTPDIYRNDPTFSKFGLPINIKEAQLLTNANISVLKSPNYIGSFINGKGQQDRPLINSRMDIPYYIGWDKKIVKIKDAILEGEKEGDYDYTPYNEKFTNVQQGLLGRASIIPSSSFISSSEEQTKTGDVRYDGRLDVERREGFNRSFFSNAMTYDNLVNQTPKRPSPNAAGNRALPITPGSDYSTVALAGDKTNTGFYAIENRIQVGGVGKSDGINMKSLYSDTSNPFVDETSIYKNSARDLIKFGFEAICNNCPDTTKVHFRSFITAFSDGHTANWEGTRYAGRGEQFYTYQGADRSVQVSFLIAATSKEEMKPLWQKLNFLVSTLYPDYSNNGYMRGNLIRLTVGEYFYRTPGILTNININIENEYPWEIKMRSTEGVSGDKQMELPMLCSISFGFIPILDDLPRRGTKVPIVITNKTTGIQSYLNDPDLINECLPQPVAQPKPVEPISEPTSSVTLPIINIPSERNEIAIDNTDTQQRYNQIKGFKPLDESDLNQRLRNWQTNPDNPNFNSYNDAVIKNNQQNINNLTPITKDFSIDGVEVTEDIFNTYTQNQNNGN